MTTEEALARIGEYRALPGRSPLGEAAAFARLLADLRDGLDGNGLLALLEHLEGGRVHDGRKRVWKRLEALLDRRGEKDRVRPGPEAGSRARSRHNRGHAQTRGGF